MSYLAKLAAIALILSFTGCASVSKQQQLQCNETAPICYDKADCNTKWAAARTWIQENSGYKIQIYSDDLIETYNPAKYDTKIAVSASKSPLRTTPDGNQIYSISIRVNCGNIFGCTPPIRKLP